MKPTMFTHSTPMKTIGQSLVSTQFDFERAVAQVGDTKVVVESTSMGLDINTMTSAPIVRLWDAKDGNGIKVEVANAYLRPSAFDIRYDSQLPEIDFVRISNSDELERDLRRMGL